MRSLTVFLLMIVSAHAGTGAYNTATNKVIELKRGGSRSTFQDKLGYAVVNLDDENSVYSLGIEYCVYDPVFSTIIPMSSEQISEKKQARINSLLNDIQARLDETQTLMANTTDQLKYDALCDLEVELKGKVLELTH